MPKKPLLTQAQVTKALTVWTIRLNLMHWKITLEFNPEEEPSALQSKDCEAEIHISDDYNEATIIFEKTWPTWDKLNLNETILHELLHIHFHGIEHASLSCRDFMGTEARRLYVHRFHHELEKTVETLTQVLITTFGVA